MKKIVFLFLCFSSNFLWSQENFESFFEPEIEIGYNVNTGYSHSFSVENRNYIYKEGELQFEVKQIEFSHTSSFQLNNDFEIGLGIQYRFEDIFNSSEENEFRLLQEFVWKKEQPVTSFKYRLRNEQRFYASTTKYRIRNEIGFKFPIKNSDATYIKLETEALIEVAKTQKMELEQRAGLLVGNSLFRQTILEIGLQYRLADYTQDLGHELFLIMGIEIEL